MLRFADRVEERLDELTAIDAYDMGFPIGLSHAVNSGEFTPANVLRYYAGYAGKVHGETVENGIPGMFSYTLRQPIGVVGVIIPWNAPRFVATNIAPVLATGCTMVLKPSELACLSPIVLTEILDEIGLPAGVLNLVTGFGETAGAALANHDDVDLLTFTGSTATGQSLIRAAAGNLKRLTLELGGKSPAIICADADLAQAIPYAAMGVFYNSGQMCTAGSRVFVERPVYDEVVDGLAGAARGYRVGSALDPQTTIGPIISAGQLERVTSYLELGKGEGVTVHAGGSRNVQPGLEDGFFVDPTVFADARDDMRISTEEIFGPVVTVMPFDHLDEAVRRANDTKYGLGAGIYTRDMGKAHHVAKALRSGMVWINAYNSVDFAMPFGGQKMSGWGSTFSHHSLEPYLALKGVWMQTPDPPTD
jgi:aldehyde dehydrogenase (NAD+)